MALMGKIYLMTFRIFIHANNIHSGGGRSLLLNLLQALDARGGWFAILDTRIRQSLNLFSHGQALWISPSFFQRIKSEWWLSINVQPNDLLICFGNLPPLFRSRGRVVVFLQNRYLIENVALAGFSMRVRWRIHVERLWFAFRARNADLFVVQSPTMQRLLAAITSSSARTLVLPFVGRSVRSGLSDAIVNRQDQGAPDFVYVASGEPHKNHRNLIEAWCILAESGDYPSLALTIDPLAFQDLCRWIDRCTEKHGLRVKNLGFLSAEDIQSLYARSGALIYPSQFESFGLPLVEARQYSLPILASELDFVRDILDPVQTFDPGSPVSIARAVRRFLNMHESRKQILNASEFLDTIIAEMDQ